MDDGYDVVSEVEIAPEGGAFNSASTFGIENDKRIPATTPDAAALALAAAAAAAPVVSRDAVALVPQGEDQDKREAIEWDVDTNDTPRGITWPHCYWHAKYAVRPPLAIFLPPSPSLPPSLFTRPPSLFQMNYTAFGLIDPNAVYWGQLVRGSGANVAYKLKGKFPKTIYFSYQVYASQQSAEPDQKITDMNVCTTPSLRPWLFPSIPSSPSPTLPFLSRPWAILITFESLLPSSLPPFLALSLLFDR